MKLRVVICILFGYTLVSTYAQRGRRCCRYSGSCPSFKSCILSDQSSPSDCTVLKDSKKDSGMDPKKCKEASYISSSSPKEERGLNASSFKLESYVYSHIPNSQQSFSALDLQINYSEDWERARFRLMNLDGNSIPRCVDIQRYPSGHNSPPGNYLSYDCEAGFYFFDSHQLINTAGSTYQLDICLGSSSKEACGSYLFTMPTIQQISEHPQITLIERELLLKDFILSLHSPQENLFLGLFMEKFPRELVHEYEYSENHLLAFAQLRPGNYSIASSAPGGLRKWNQVARFSMDGYRTSISITRITCIALTGLGVILLLISYYVTSKYCKCKKNYSALSNDPLKKESEGGINVVIISDVNHQEHADILMHLSKYLQVQTNIHKVFYAMDPITGIANHNPWIWAQQVMENINFSRDYIIFASSPSSDCYPKLYENLCENQTLMSTKCLAKMAEGNRISILDFPYSVPSSISPLVPRDVPSIPRFTIPKQMTEFFSHIQGSGSPGSNLLSKLPFDLIQKGYSDHEMDFTHAKGHEESSRLIHGINTLSFKVKKQSLKDVPKQKSQTRILETNYLEKIPHPVIFKAIETPPSQREEPLEFEIEKNVLSLRNEGVVSGRDTAVNVEFA